MKINMCTTSKGFINSYIEKAYESNMCVDTLEMKVAFFISILDRLAGCYNSVIKEVFINLQPHSKRNNMIENILDTITHESIHYILFNYIMIDVGDTQREGDIQERMVSALLEE